MPRSEPKLKPERRREIASDRRLLANLGKRLKTSVDRLPDRVGSLQDQVKELKRQVRKLEARGPVTESGGLRDIDAEAADVDGVKVYVGDFGEVGAGALRKVADDVKGRDFPFIAFLTNKTGNFVLATSKGAREKVSGVGSSVQTGIGRSLAGEPGIGLVGNSFPRRSERPPQ